MCALNTVAASSKEKKILNHSFWNDAPVTDFTASYDGNSGIITIRVRDYYYIGHNTKSGNGHYWLNDTYLKYSSNGIDYTNISRLDNSSFSWPGDNNISAVESNNSTYFSYRDNSDNNHYITYSIYIGNNYRNISKIMLSGKWTTNPDGSGQYDGDHFDTGIDISVPQMTTLNTPTYEFLNNGTTRLSYTKNSLSGMDGVSKILLYNSGNYVGSAGQAAMNGSLTVPFSNSDQTYLFQQIAFGRVSFNSSNISVPAFTLPLNASASYDTLTQKALLNWSINSVSSSNVIRDKFKIQQADNPDFNNPVNTSVDYDQTKSAYSIPITNLGPHQYFRIARDHGDFDWTLAVKTDLSIPVGSLDQKSVKLVLQADNSARITWSPLNSEWVPGASFVITRINKTSNAQSTINLSKADFMTGSYTDSEIQICNQYAYAVQVVPPQSSAFTAYPLIKTINSILPSQIGTVSDLTVSKGYFPDRTELSWSSKGVFDNFIIKRAVYGSTHFVELSSVPGSSTADYQTDDTKGTPGTYYTYQVIGVVNCNKLPIYSDTISNIGFRSPTGNVYGRITYTNGQAVKDVAIRLQTDEAGLARRSMSLTGQANSYLKIGSLNTPFADSAFTVEAWIKPADAAPKNQVLFSSSKQYELGFNGSGQLYFADSSSGGAIVTAKYSNPGLSFIHVAGIHKKDSLLLMTNDSVLARIKISSSQANAGDNSVYMGANAGGNNFKGLITEVRAWNIGLNEKYIAKNYTRILAGGESGLAAYWRFNETIVDHFYDVSHHNDDYNQNDGMMDSRFVTRSPAIPTSGQLSLKSFSDTTGNYLITGIPYSGNGTTYTIVPLLGTHQFDPSSVNRLMSVTSSEFTVDFKDNSSFPVSGTIYYSNSTVPVAGVQFKIDGQYAQESNGAIIQTDATGAFSISVPVGSHEVQAFKNNHVFENNGRITDMTGKILNYQGPVSQRILRDKTTIHFIGRVAGGAIQDAFPLGHSLSGNNLGAGANIVLDLPSGDKYQLYAGQGTSTVYVKHLLPSNQKDSTKVHKSRIVYGANNITIFPDSITGEFEVNLIPENFIAESVNVIGWGNIIDGKKVSLDFTNKFAVTNIVNAYSDSSQVGQQAFIHKNYTDTVRYNASYKFIERVTPNVSIVQKDNSGNDLPYFGEKSYISHSFDGTNYTIPVTDSSKADRLRYAFGNPIFIQHQTYQFEVKAFEVYNFYDRVVNGINMVRTVNGVDNVPTKDGRVNILNSIKTGAVSVDTLSLDAKGQGIYSFTAGDPDLASMGLKNFSMSVKFGAETTVNWDWYHNSQMAAYVMGAKLTGTNFVTAGPDELLMVLRDPPGSTSFSTASKGTVISNTTTYSGSVDQAGDDNWKHNTGFDVTTFTGIGAGVITNVSASTGIGLGIHHEEHYTHTNTKVSTTTLTTNFQTSGDPAFVGAPADVFVGYSTNITYGQSNNITMIKRSELKASDTKFYEHDTASTYLIVLRTGLNLGETFGTMFAFPQVHIQNVLIPNLVSIRNALLFPSGTAAAAAQALANSSKKQVYVSKLAIGDARFGKSNHDTSAFGPSAASDLFSDGKSYTIYFPASTNYRTDTISTLNQYVSKWIQRLSDNEKAKLESTLLQNYSFHAGSPITYSKVTTNNTAIQNSFNIIIAGSISGSVDAKVIGQGFNFDFNESIGTNQGGDFGSSNETDETLGFTLSSAGSDDYFSVDVNTAKDNSFVFRTKGGVSGCPYEGANATTYYQPGSALDQPTQRIEVPKISVDKPVVNNIASLRSASYVLSLKNESEAKIDGSFNLSYADNDSIRGAVISIDGTPIGGSGRIITVPYGQTIEKVLTIAKGPTAMNYNNIQIILKSGCQSSIADTVLVSAHFIPSCSDIHIKSPTDNWVINTQSPTNDAGNRYVPIVLTQFDVNNSLFDHIELQYKAAAQSTWITAVQFFADPLKLKVAQGKSTLITNAAEIDYNLVMDEAAFSDQNYNIRAVSVCVLGPNNLVTTESNLINGIKDTYNPRLFGSPQPANGLLGISDNIRLNFNKTIAAGLLTSADFQVTGIRNGVPGNHTVSVNLDGISNYLQTEFSKNLTGKNITTELWVLQNPGTGGTVFSQGNANQSMELGLTAEHYLQVIVGAKVIKSLKPVPYKEGEWAHVALIYNSADTTITALYNFSEVISGVPVKAYTGIGAYQFGRSISLGGNFFSGKMHRACIWSKVIPSTTIQINSLINLSGAENNLLGYYPMDEGKGTICSDKAHGSNATLKGLWSTPAGKSISLPGNSYVKLNTSFAPITASMDYTLELWFKGNPGQANATLASTGKGDNSDNGGSQNLFFLGFENKLLTFRNNGFLMQTDGNYLDNNWHHVAIAVNRTSGIAQLYTDGVLKSFYDAKNLGGLASASTYLGVRAWYNQNSGTTVKLDNYFKGQIDEFRIWNTYLDKDLIPTTNNVRLKGDEIGLLAYYPFENYYTFQNNQEMAFSLQDLKVQPDPKVKVPDGLAVNAVASDDKAPIKDRGPVDNLKFDFVVNNDGLIVNLDEPKQAVDKIIVTIKVANVRDMNGNKIASPITWTAYINQNPVQWSDNSLNLSKPVDSAMKFESYIVNSGGSVEHFTLNNLPGWLTASETSGNVSPNSKEKIVFTVNQSLNIGTYNEDIFMINSSAQSASLSLNMVVKGKKPAWSVDPAKYKYNMTVYGQMRIDKLFSTDKEDIIGAFVNGKCVGVTNNTYNAQSDLWYTFLNIYSDSIKHDKLVFRIWQASTGQIYQAIPTPVVPFVNNAVAGTIRNPIIFDGLKSAYEDIQLVNGWNWISFNVTDNVTANDINATLINGKWDSGDIIKNQESGFHQYSKANGWLGTLPGINNTALFMIQTGNPQTLSIAGIPVDIGKTAIPVRHGRWNYISYLPLINMTLNDALAGYEAADEDVIKSQAGFSMFDTKMGWVGNLTYLEPGKGYMLYSKHSRDTSFYYPQAKTFVSLSRPVHNLLALNSFQTPVAANGSFAQNMTVAAKTAAGFVLRPSDYVIAYIAGEVRSRARLIPTQVAGAQTLFFNIPGDHESSVSFQVERDGKVIAESRTQLTYGNNRQIGSLAKPVVIEFKKVADNLLNVFPNPFTDELTISTRISGGPDDIHRVQLLVYNTTGQVIIIQPELKTKTGFCQLSWNGRDASGMTVLPGIYLLVLDIDGVKHYQKVIKQ